MFRKKGAIVLLAMLVAVVLLLACAAPREKIATATPGAKTPAAFVTPGVVKTPTKGEYGVTEPVYEPGRPGGVFFYLGQYGWVDPPRWDPSKETSYRLHPQLSYVHGKLFSYGYGPKNSSWDYTAHPELCESWEMSADGKTYTLHLRKGVKYHNIPPVNGREWTAEDAKYTLERMRDTPASPLGYRLKVVNKVECPDKYTLVVRLDEPRAGFIRMMADGYMHITLARECEKTGEFDWRGATIGTGPWILVEYTVGVKQVYKKNPDYWQKGLPYMDGIALRDVPDTSTQLAAFRAGQLDIRGISRLDIESVWGTNPTMKCYNSPIITNSTGLWLRVDQPPFDDIRVRQAISMAINRQEWIEAVCYGYGTHQYGATPPDSEWWLPVDKLGEKRKYVEYNPEEAKRLLAEAGYPKGFKTTLWTTTGYGTTITENAELFKDMLSRIGIESEIKLKEYAAWLSTVYVGKFDGLAYAWFHGAAPDPDDWYCRRYLLSPEGTLNQSNVDDPELRKMILAQRAALSDQERLKILQDIQYYLADKCYDVYDVKCYGIACVQPWVHNYQGHSNNYDYGRQYLELWLDETVPKR